tara:strand:- start:9030 stop:9689 length:660 start_codon:yes stop_codon:yes gene_type:complete
MVNGKGNLWAGIVGGFAATTCCIAPVVLILSGFGTAFGMAVMHQFHIVSIVAGIVFMLLLSLYLIKRKAGVCNLQAVKQNWKGVAIAIVIMVVSWTAINYLVVQTAANIVYGNLEVEKKPLGNLQEMALSHGMPEMAEIEIIPENQGEKMLILEIDGVFCGACGPAIEFDLNSIQGVIEVTKKGKQMEIIYDSDVTSKDVIVASVHDPYTASIVLEKII